MSSTDTRTPSHVSGSLLPSRASCVFESIVVILFPTALLFSLHLWAGKIHIEENRALTCVLQPGLDI